MTASSPTPSALAPMLRSTRRLDDPVAALQKATGGGAHGVLITAPSLSAFKQGVEMTRKLGTCVLVGLPPGDFPVPLFGVVANCVTIRGSFVGTREDMAEALAFAAQGKVKADIELQPLTAINKVFDRLQHGDVRGTRRHRFRGGLIGKTRGACSAPVRCWWKAGPPNPIRVALTGN